MSKKLVVAAMAAGLAMMAAPQAANDAPGVAVNTNGALLIHRSPVEYPPEAMAKGVHGTVTAQVKLDANGEVSDALIVSGPDELRRAVLQSVLGWHFMKSEAGTTRTVNVEFTVPKNVPAAPAAVRRVGPAASEPAGVGAHPLASISIEGVSDQAREELTARLPVHVGDSLDGPGASDKLVQALKEYDSHLVIRIGRNPDGTAWLRIFPGTAQAAAGGQMIRVGGNVQAANLISQVRPVYPPEAKAARIQGQVRLEAIIGPDGTVQSLQVVSGDPALVKSALDAVKQWVYKPTLLNGNPVTVATTIDVNYTLSN